MIGLPALQRFEDPQVERAPPFLHEARIGDLVRQRVLEGVLHLRIEARLVEEFGGGQMR